jgi:AcrR family transcriptional regulator
MSGAQGTPTAERIVDVASMLFYEKGYHGTTMREIAQGVQIKAGSLYNHFDGKQELLTHISLVTTEALYQGALQRLENVEGLEERLRVFIKWHVEFHARERLAARVTDEQLHLLAPENRKRVAPIRDAHEQILRDLLEEGARNGGWEVDDSAVIAFAIFSMCTQVDVWYREDGRLSPEEIGEVFADFILRGLRADRRRRRRDVASAAIGDGRV